MKYLHIIAEGHSEEEFVRKVLTPHLSHFEVYVSCQKVHTGGNKVHPIKGGLGKVPKYQPIKRALERWIEADKHNRNVIYSTMLDLYAFPKDEESPYGEEIMSIQNKYNRIKSLEETMFEKHGIENFIPYVQLHEFETLILVDLEPLKVMYPDRKSQIDELTNEIDGENVELINDGRNSAPSKRIINAVPNYENQKNTVGPIVVEDIGIEKLKSSCRHFKEWLTKLEQLNEL